MRPIFIGGVPRSGTTMLGSMLGTHPSHVAVPEMQFKIDLLAAVGPDGRLDAQRAAAIAGDSRFRSWGIGAGILRELGGATYREGVERLVRAYAGAAGKPDPGVWIDHTPRNMLVAATLSDAFPDGRLVHLVRDGRGVAASLLRVDWGPSSIDDAATMWLARLCHGLAAETADGGILPVVRVHYEALVTEPEPTLRRLCEQLELEYEPAMAGGAGFTPPRSARPIHGLVGAPPSAARAEAWRQELTPRQIEIFESLAADALRLVGYEPDHGWRARPASRGERARFRLRRLVVRPLVRARRRRRRRLDA